jgi:hypothetical protein
MMPETCTLPVGGELRRWLPQPLGLVAFTGIFQFDSFDNALPLKPMGRDIASKSTILQHP